MSEAAVSKPYMAEPTTTTEGLDTFFESDAQTGLDNAGLKMKQAVHYYALSVAQIKRKIREGAIPAIRIGDGKGKKWKIFPNGVPPELQSFSYVPRWQADDPTLFPPPMTSEEAVPLESLQPPQMLSLVELEAVDVEDSDQEFVLVNELRDRIRDLEERLQSASYRNGYLEAQVSNLEEKVRLVHLRQDPPGWMSRFRAFFGR